MYIYMVYAYNFLKRKDLLTAVPLFLSCGRPYSQRTSADGPLERSGAAIGTPTRTGNSSLDSIPQNGNCSTRFFSDQKKVTYVSDFLDCKFKKTMKEIKIIHSPTT